MEHAHESESLSLFASWNSAPPRARPLGVIIAAVVQILGIEFLTRPRMTAMSRTWLRQHEVESGKYGQA
jgi:hypothetical protein